MCTRTPVRRATRVHQLRGDGVQAAFNRRFANEPTGRMEIFTIEWELKYQIYLTFPMK